MSCVFRWHAINPASLRTHRVGREEHRSSPRSSTWAEESALLMNFKFPSDRKKSNHGKREVIKTSGLIPSEDMRMVISNGMNICARESLIRSFGIFGLVTIYVHV